jgi:hypothetical protein
VDELRERAQIRDVLVRYTVAFRRKDVNLLDTVFAPGAVIDYRESGGSQAGWATTKEWVASVLDGAHLFLLYIGDSAYTFGDDGASADVETSWHGVFVQDAGGPTMFIYGTYEDRFARTGDGWRIAARTDHPLWQVVPPVAAPIEGA